MSFAQRWVRVKLLSLAVAVAIVFLLDLSLTEVRLLDGFRGMAVVALVWLVVGVGISAGIALAGPAGKH